jgi:hypothetical protein
MHWTLATPRGRLTVAMGGSCPFNVKMVLLAVPFENEGPTLSLCEVAYHIFVRGIVETYQSLIEQTWQPMSKVCHVAEVCTHTIKTSFTIKIDHNYIKYTWYISLKEVSDSKVPSVPKDKRSSNPTVFSTVF